MQLFNIGIQFEIESREEKNRRQVDEIYQTIAELNKQINSTRELAQNTKDSIKKRINKKIPKLKE